MSDTMSDTVPEDGNVAATAPDQGKILLAVSILTNVVALWTCIMRVLVNRADKRETHWADRFVGLAMVRTAAPSLTLFLSFSLAQSLKSSHRHSKIHDIHTALSSLLILCNYVTPPALLG